jgi:hypothetical protein
MQPNQAQEPHGPTLAATFANLKSRLVLQRLNEAPEPETHASIMKQANEAALLAWLSGYPLLAFPCLFEERAIATTEQARRHARRYWNNLPPPNSPHVLREAQAAWRQALSQTKAARTTSDPAAISCSSAITMARPVGLASPLSAQPPSL